VTAWIPAWKLACLIHRQTDCWGIWPDRGFLANPDPIENLGSVDSIDRYFSATEGAMLEEIAERLPSLVENREFRK